MEFEITTSGQAKQLATRLDEVPENLKRSTEQTAMRRIVQRLHDYVVRHKLTGDPLNSRTRTLARSVFHRVERHNDDITGRVGYDLAKARYGRAQELGATIVPVKAKNLTIPVGEALTASGVTRISAREFIALTSGGKNAAGWRGFTSSFVNKNKTAILGVRASGSVEAVFLLRKKVTLESKPALRETLNENLPDIKADIEQTVADVLQRISA